MPLAWLVALFVQQCVQPVPWLPLIASLDHKVFLAAESVTSPAAGVGSGAASALKAMVKERSAMMVPLNMMDEAFELA